MSDSHAIEPDFGTGKKTLLIYVTGLLLCILLTLIPFGAVLWNKIPKGATFVIIYTAAIVQFLVQVVCFLRLNTRTEQGMINVMSFIFSIIVLLVVVGGSVWIMWNLNYHMMH